MLRIAARKHSEEDRHLVGHGPRRRLQRRILGTRCRLQERSQDLFDSASSLPLSSTSPSELSKMSITILLPSPVIGMGESQLNGD